MQKSSLPISVRSRMPVIFPPERQDMTKSAVAIGYACRVLVLWWAVWALDWFVADAFLLTTTHDGPLSVGYLALVSAIATLAFAAMTLSRVARLIGIAGMAAGLGWALVGFTPAFWYNHGATALNACLARLIKMGYGGPASALLPVAEGAADLTLSLQMASALLAALLAAGFVPALLRRTHVALPSVIGAAILIPVFTYNITRSNWPLAFVVAAFAAILVLAAFDRRYLRPDPDCDNEARILPVPPDRPKLLPRPAHLETRAERRARRQAERERIRSADEEIEHYLGKAPAKVKLSAAEKKARRLAEREYEASKRALRRWQRGQRSARIAAGGFAGVGMLALALAMLAIPAAVTDKSFRPVEFIDEPMQLVRRYVTAYLMGDNPILDEMGYGGNASNFAPHSTDASPRLFTGEEIFSIETMYSTNLYLRGWVAADYRDGSWYTADSRGDDVTFENYRGLFGTAFSPESLRTSFYRYVDPTVNTYTDYTKRYQNHTERGFVTMQVNLRRLGGNSNMVYLPAYYNPEIGVLQYTSDQPTEYSYVNYFDGIYTGRRFLPGAEYAAVSYATTMRDDTFMQKVGVDIAAYNLACYYYHAKEQVAALGLGEGLTVADKNGMGKMTATRRDGGVVVDLDLINRDESNVLTERTLLLAEEILSRFFNYAQADQAELDHAIYVEGLYRDFVYSTYRDRADSPIISAIAEEIVDLTTRTSIADAVDASSDTVNPEAYIERHNAVMAVMHYLAEEKDLGEVDAEGNAVLTPTFKYTLTPTAQPDPDLDGVENFLTVTREGYCVQFASAAVLLLREMGIPARYVEGYIAPEFRRNLAATSDQRYSATVRDYNAHAWIEVWYDGIGWLNYEATPVYMADMYEPIDSSVSSAPYRPWQPSTEEEEENPIDPEELARLEAELAAAEARRRRIIIACVALAATAVVIVIAAIVAFFLRRARRADEAREARYAAAAEGHATRADARVLIDEVTALLAAYGFAPTVGEQRPDYATRLDESLGALSPMPLSELYAAIAAEEFGSGMDTHALRALAAFRRNLGDVAKQHLRLGSRIRYRYAKRLL